MNKLVLCFLFLTISLVGSSQKVYFVYLQSETDQPFFVKMNEKVNSSTASGYLILSKLHDSIYNFSIGFPQNKWPEQNFTVPIKTKDHGYLLKNFGDKGWGLFDLQTLAVIMSSSANVATQAAAKTDPKDISAFTDILSKAADDPSLKDKPVQAKIEEKKAEVKPQETVKKEEPKAEVKETVTIKPVEVVEKPVVKKEEPKAEVKETVTASSVQIEEKPIAKTEQQRLPVKTPDATKPAEVIEQAFVKKDEPKEEIKETVTIKPVEVVEQPKENTPVEEYKKSIVTKRSENSTTEGFGLVFLDDNQNGVKDTIRLIIPNPKQIVQPINEQSKEEKKFLDIPTDPAKQEEKKTVADVQQVPTIKPTTKFICTATASDADFLKLRKNMAASETEDDMVIVANKDFRSKCYSVQQLKNLSTLFLNDAGKYKFFDAAYISTSDIENFGKLQAEMKDEYYINRFKAMLRN